MKNDEDKIIRDFLAKTGRKGGNARAAKYGKATLRKWGKKGGRPRKPKESVKK
jgi:hypothetical protein